MSASTLGQEQVVRHKRSPLGRERMKLKFREESPGACERVRKGTAADHVASQTQVLRSWAPQGIHPYLRHEGEHQPLLTRKALFLRPQPRGVTSRA